MGYDHKRLSGRESRDGALDLVLVLWIGERGGLVEQDDRRVFEDRAGYRDTLALPTGKGAASRTGLRVIALREL